MVSQLDKVKKRDREKEPVKRVAIKQLIENERQKNRMEKMERKSENIN